MTILNQRYFFSTKTFELLDNKVLIREKSLFDDKEWEARYDQIGLDLTKIKSREGLGNAVLFGGLLAVTGHMTYKAFTDGTDIKLAIMFLLFSFLWLTVFWWSIQKYFAAHFILGGGNKTLTFFIDSPNEKTVKEFIETIKSKTKDKLKQDLTTFDPDLNFDDQLDHIKYLKSIEVLTQDEFEVVREYLREKHLLK
jgi:hypothetical protein